jgi:hypothetical protein
MNNTSKFQFLIILLSEIAQVLNIMVILLIIKITWFNTIHIRIYSIW